MLQTKLPAKDLSNIYLMEKTAGNGKKISVLVREKLFLNFF